VVIVDGGEKNKDDERSRGVLSRKNAQYSADVFSHAGRHVRGTPSGRGGIPEALHPPPR